MDRRATRLKLLVDQYFVVLVAGCLLLIVLGGYLTYTTHVDPGTETERFEESSWSSSVELTHGATVTEETTVFEAGERVAGRELYFTSIMPESEGTVEYEYQATDGGELDVTTALTAVVRSVQDDEDEPTELWRQEEPLAGDSQEGVAPGDTVEVPFALNVTELERQADRIDGELGGSPGNTEVLVVTELAVSGELNGQTVEESYRYESVLDLGGTVYGYEDVGPFEESDQQFGERELEVEHGLARSALPVVVILAGVAGMGLLGGGRYRSWFEVSAAEREWLEYRTAYEEYDEWISTGQVSADAHPGSAVAVDTLDQLVDVGIDSDRRVIHDRGRQQCLVLVDDVAYTYDVPDRPVDREASVHDPDGHAVSAGEHPTGEATDGGPASVADETAQRERLAEQLRSEHTDENGELDYDSLQSVADEYGVSSVDEDAGSLLEELVDRQLAARSERLDRVDDEESARPGPDTE